MIKSTLSVLAFACGLIFLSLTTGAALADRRVALVIGNSQYKNASNILINPQNDASDVATALRALGFEVLLTVDANKREFDLSLQKFAHLATDADAALFYYAGHAMQFQGRNYLMPTDAELEDEVSLPYQMVAFDAVQFAIDRAKGPKIIILDACRNNPVANRFVRSVFPTRDFGGMRGLARIDRAQGMVVSYATATGEVAEDGKTRNSPYTTALLKRMQEAGLEIEMMFRRVAQDVSLQTNGRQRPETVISLLNEFYLNRTDVAAWEKIKNSDDPAAFRAFVAAYPSSALALNAQFRLDTLLTAKSNRDQVETERVARERAMREEAQRDADARREAERKIAEAEKRIAALAAQNAPPPTSPRPDAIAWDFLKDSNDAAALKRFIEEFPDSTLRASAELRIASLTAAQHVAPSPGPSPEDIAWNMVKDTKDADQLRRFIEQFPASARRAEVEQRVAALAALPPHAAQPPPSPPVDWQEITRSLQLELKRVGCFDGPVDGRSKDATQVALRKFAKFAKFASVGVSQDDLTTDTLKAIRGFDKRVCPLVCPAGEKAEGDQCIRIACPSGEIRKDGSCVARPTPGPKRRVTVAPEPKAHPAKAPRGGKCFSFQGRQFCE